MDQRLTFQEYQTRTRTTAAYRDKIAEMFSDLRFDSTTAELVQLGRLEVLLNISYCALGLGEVGEVQGKIKKIIRDAGGVITPDAKKAISKELGDCLWYISETAAQFGLDLGYVAEENLAKLADRKERGVITGSGDNR